MDTPTQQAFKDLRKENQKSFEKMFELFGSSNKHLNRIDKRLYTIEERLDIMEFLMTSKFDEVNQRFDKVDIKLDQLYSHVDGLTSLHLKHDAEIMANRARIERVEA